MRIQIQSGAEQIEAVRVVPDGGPHPGVIVVHDGGGFGDHAIGVAQELADAGYAALAVNLYSRGGPAPDLTNAELLAFLRSVPDRQIIQDLQSTIDTFAEDPAVASRPLGMLGYCWGGACTFLASARCRGLAAAASWYGELVTEELNADHPEHPIDALDDRSCPVLALFGELDPYVSVKDAERLRDRGHHNSHPLDVVIYPGLNHGFAHRGRDHFDADGHDDGWGRIWALFDRELRQK